MTRFLALLAMAVFVATPFSVAQAQTVNAVTVSACGTPNNSPVVGNSYPMTQDLTGVLCTSATGGGGGPSAITIASGAVASGAYASGSIASGAISSGAVAAGAITVGSAVDGWDITEGTKADSAYAGSGSASVVSALKGIYAAAAGAIPTQGNTVSIGGVGILSSTTGGTTAYGLQTTASTNSTSVKGSAGTLYGLNLINTTTTIYYLRMYDASSAPTCSSATNFSRTWPIPPAGASGGAGGVAVSLPVFGVAFANGIAFCVTGGPSSTDNTNAATGVFINIDYK